MDSRHVRGRRGEEIAARHLEARGWRVVDRNWRAGHAEIDLVAEKGDILAFVEVKTRSGPGCGDPLEWLSLRQRREVEGAARAWLRAQGEEGGKGGTGWSCVRFDAVAVDLFPGRPGNVRHIPDAWRVGDP